MTLGPFFKATKDYDCSQCDKQIYRNDRMRMGGRGIYICYECGIAAQSENMGPNETGVMNDLSKLPAEAKEGSLAANMIFLAQQLDDGFVASRDAGTYTKEIRQSLLTLRLMFPPDPEKDKTDDFLKRRQEHLSSLRES